MRFGLVVAFLAALSPARAYGSALSHHCNDEARRETLLHQLSRQSGLFGACITAEEILECMCDGGNDKNAIDVLALSRAGFGSDGPLLARLCASERCRFAMVTKSLAYTIQQGDAALASVSAEDITKCVCSDPGDVAPKLRAATPDLAGLQSNSQCGVVAAATADSSSSHVACPEKDDDPCFPSSATVKLANGTVRSIDALRPGDAIVAVDASGDLTTGIVSTLSTASPEAQASFLNLTTPSATLLVTPEHHLPVGAACCTHLKKARDVAVGDVLWTASVTGARAVRVTAKGVAVGWGLHSPVLTNGAFPVVEGIITSFDRIEAVTFATYGLQFVEPLLQAAKVVALWSQSKAAR